MDTETPGRPFGLLLLTGLSFGIAVLNLFVAGQLVVAERMKGGVPTDTGFDVAVLHSLWALPSWAVGFLIGTAVVKSVLLFVAAWGYFRFKRVAGRYVGSAYAVVSLVESAVMALGLDYPITPGTLIGVLFALFTLAFVNGPYKALLVR
jgi:hypothetical protein